jgi:hypothetical protein
MILRNSKTDRPDTSRSKINSDCDDFLLSPQYRTRPYRKVSHFVIIVCNLKDLDVVFLTSDGLTCFEVANLILLGPDMAYQYSHSR